MHTAPIYITVKNSPPLITSDRTQAIAQAHLARLKDLETRFRDIDLDNLKKDGIDSELIVKNQAALLNEINTAKVFFTNLLNE